MTTEITSSAGCNGSNHGVWRIVVALLIRITGGLMLGSSALYTAHYLYDLQQVWTAFNVISVVAILIALASKFACMLAQSGRQQVTVRGSALALSSTPTAPCPYGSTATGFTCWPWKRTDRSAFTRTSSG